MKRDILYIGSTTIDYIFPDRIGIISGSGARSAFATATEKPTARIGLITALGKDDEFQERVRTILHDAGVEIFSQPDAKTPVSIYDEGYGKKPTRQKKNDTFVFDPAKAAEGNDFSPGVAVFSGGQTVYNQSSMEAYADHLAAGGTTIILDINARKHVDTSVTRSWAQKAHIIKLANVDIPHLMDGSTDIEAAANTWLDWGKDRAHGAKLVCVTLDGEGTMAYWRESGVTKHLLVPPSQTLTLKNDVGAGDAFDAGIALACSELALNTKSFDHLNKNTVKKIVARGNEVAVNALRTANLPTEKRPDFFRSVTDGAPLEEIVQSIYKPTRSLHRDIKENRR